ncbi:MAG: hypothetical protein V2I41_20030, partial [Pseudomonadales bacterium]|nr:hypothetical protein [Pseudomonadales bacterium]
TASTSLDNDSEISASSATLTCTSRKAAPPAPEQLSEKLCDCCSELMTCWPFVERLPLQPPDASQLSVLVLCQDSVTEPPGVTDEDEAENVKVGEELVGGVESG